MIFTSRPPPAIFVIHGDDRPDVYVRYLTSAGFRVASGHCRPGAEIVDRTLAVMPDLIMLDHDDDADTVKRLQADRRTAAIPVISLGEFMSLSRPETAGSTS